MKKALVLTSNGGGGTLSASAAIEEYLKEDYSVTTIHVFVDLLNPIDFCSKLTLGKYSCEDIYNLLIPRKYFRSLALLYYIGKWYISLQKKRIRTILHDYILKTKPSVIISVVPIMNDIILSIAQELDIPFLLIPTDLDVRMYIINIIKPTYKKFYIGIPFDDNDLAAPLKKIGIKSEHIMILGAPLKQSFFAPKDIFSLKKEFSIPENKPVIMLIMGAQGSSGISAYVNQLITITYPFHLIICTGKNGNQHSYNSIPAHISTSVISFTTRIADLMALADVIITKSGSLSVCEAIYMNVPLILDATSYILPWEQFNHQFIDTHNFGTSIYKYSDIISFVSLLLEHPDTLTHYKNNLEKLHKENIEIRIGECVEKMVGE